MFSNIFQKKRRKKLATKNFIIVLKYIVVSNKKYSVPCCSVSLWANGRNVMMHIVQSFGLHQ